MFVLCAMKCKHRLDNTVRVLVVDWKVGRAYQVQATAGHNNIAK